MGCQSSRLKHQKEEMLPKLPPILSRKLEEIRRRRAGATLSKKQLLKDGYEDDSASGHHKSCVSSPDPDDDSIGSAMVAPEPTEPEEMFSDRGKHDNKNDENAEDKNNNKEEDDDDGIGSANVAPEPTVPEDDEKEKVAVAVNRTTEKLAMEEKEDELQVEEYGRFSSLEGPLTCPASPSFRYYLIDSLQDKKDDHGKDDYMNKGSLSDTDVDTADIVESQTSTEESAMVIKKRGRRGMKLKRVITRGKPVKTLLSVKSCYYPSCGDRQVSPRLIAAKSATS